MSVSRLRSGRHVISVHRDREGRPVYYETYDTRTNRREIHTGELQVSDRSRSDGPSVSETELPELMEFFLEEYQTHWTHPTVSKRLIHFPGAFPWCEPKAGDQLTNTDGKIYRVLHAGRGADGATWNCVVLLDQDIEIGERISWVGEDSRKRALVNFYEDDGHPASPLPGEDTNADVGTAYRGIVGPTVTYLLVVQEPGTIGPKPFSRDKVFKPRIREQFRDPSRPQVTITIFGHMMDSLFSFLCLHPRSAVAGELARWFKRFVRDNTSSLKANGVNEILYQSQRAERRRRRAGDDAAVREVVFFFRTEELFLEETSNLRGIDVNLRVTTSRVFSWSGDTGLNPYTGMYDASGNYAWGDLDIADPATGTG